MCVLLTIPLDILWVWLNEATNEWEAIYNYVTYVNCKMQLYSRKRISWSLKTIPNHIANDSSEFEIFFISSCSNKQTLKTSFKDYVERITS